MSLSSDQLIDTCAARQHGVVTRSQLLDAGLTSAAIGRRVRSGRLRSLHRGVYLVGPLAPPSAYPLAAVLAGGPNALLSHWNAAVLWGLWPRAAAGIVHVSVPGTGRSRRPGIHFHRIRTPASSERAMVEGIPTTSPGRTLADVAGLCGSRELEHMLAVASREGLIDSHELAVLPDRYPRRPGMAMLRALLTEASGPDLTRSEAERRCLAMLRSARLPRPHTNVPMGVYELDLFWPDLNVAIEVDGRVFHDKPDRFERDREKDNWLRTRGIEVIHLTWRQITKSPVPTAVQVGQVLALARQRQADRQAARRAGQQTGREAGRGPDPARRPAGGLGGRPRA